MTFSPSLISSINPELDKLEKIHKIEYFLSRCNLGLYKLISIPGDCSKRHYYRVLHNKKSFILMDASEDLTSMQPFFQIGNLLKENDFSAPEIFEADFENGLMLLEDFGNNTFTKHLSLNNMNEKTLYKWATEVLVKLYNLEVPIDIPEHSPFILNRGLDTFAEWFLSGKLSPNIYSKAKVELLDIFSNYYSHLDRLKPVLVLRDYHADNLFHLPERSAHKSVGIIDFQDASLGSPVYDLISLLEDARRDISHETTEFAYNYFLNSIPTMDKTAFRNCYAVLSAQRNLRIVGVFHRMIKLHKKPEYDSKLPRVWRYIKDNIHKNELTELGQWFEKYGVSIEHN